MEIKLTDSQAHQLKEDAKKEIIDQIKEEKTVGYYVARGIGMAIFGLCFLGFIFGLNYLTDRKMDGYSHIDNWDSCWVEAKIEGVDSDTGEKATKGRHFDCSNFEPKE